MTFGGEVWQWTLPITEPSSMMYSTQLTILQLHEGRTLLSAGGPGPEDLQRKYFHI